MNERLRRDYETFENGRKRGVEETLEGAIPVEVVSYGVTHPDSLTVRTSDGSPIPMGVDFYLVKRNPNPETER